jgi:hypothetical protein
MTTTKITTYEVSLPATFWEDHRRRCVTRLVPVNFSKRGVIHIELNGGEIADLWDDANIYASLDGDEFDGAAELADSAHATRKAILWQFPNVSELRAIWHRELNQQWIERIRAAAS